MLDDRANYWTPVDQYVGGIEHAVLHLLYARFIHKVLRDLNIIHSHEPFKKLLTQGMVLKDGAKMSKSKGNTVSPQQLVAEYGADTVRLFSMFAAPPEQSLEWSDTGVAGACRFLKKLWKVAVSAQPSIVAFHQSQKKTVEPVFQESIMKSHYRAIQQILQQANADMQRQQFNTVVSAGMKLLNILPEIDSHSAEGVALMAMGFSILLRLLAPITPHIVHVLWCELGFTQDVLAAGWPSVDVRALQSLDVEMMVQINGKLRGKITVSVNETEDALKTKALAEKNIQPWLQDQKVQRIIIVPNRLINIVISK